MRASLAAAGFMVVAGNPVYFIKNLGRLGYNDDYILRKNPMPLIW
jgi:hypothetical protein